MTNSQIHDLKTVYADFKIILNLIRSGYRFDDESADEIIGQLVHALDLFKSEITSLEEFHLKNTKSDQSESDDSIPT